MIVRLSKTLLVALVGLLLLLVGVNNIIDYQTNFVFAQHVMTMETVLPSTTLSWRAVTSLALHHAAYVLVIAVEILSGAACIVGSARLWQVRDASADRFNAAKGVAVAGLVCGFALFLFGFLTIAAEWFQMWQSKEWNAQAPAFRFLAAIGLVLLFLNQRDDDLE